jgi:hypothetical protein
MTPEWQAEEKAAAAYLRWLSPCVKEQAQLAILLKSRSWRITRRLRQIQDLLNKFRI